MILLYTGIWGYKYLHQNFSELNKQCNLDQCEISCDKTESTKNAYKPSAELENCIICNSQLFASDLPSYFFFSINEIKNFSKKNFKHAKAKLKINFKQQSARAPPFVFTRLVLQ